MPTDISWADNTWNIVRGCAKVSDGCRFCYAERIDRRRQNHLPWTARNVAANVTIYPDRLAEPATWRAPKTVFVCSMADLFVEPVADAFIHQALAVMAAVDHHVYLILTKRPERMAQVVAAWLDARDWALLPDHIWCGVSAERQREADQRIPVLLTTRSYHYFLSAEPLLDDLDLRSYTPIWDYRSTHAYYRTVYPSDGNPRMATPGIEWVIAGGESGDARGQRDRWLVEECEPGVYLPTPRGRRMVQSIRTQCEAAGIKFHLKQWGGPRYDSGGRDLDGRTHAWYPQPRPAATQGVLL